MATIVTLNPGDEVDASVLNTNFSNLNTGLTTQQSSITTLGNTVTSLQSTVTSITGGVIPIGTVIWFAKNEVPTGYLICNGAAISRTDYADLFALIGTNYGAGDGSTTFNLPNFTNKILKGGDVNVYDTTCWTTETNLNHKHSVGSSGVWTNSGSALGNHNHSTTLPTLTLKPCIKY